MSLDKIRYSIDNFEVIMNTEAFMVLSLDLISENENRHNTEFLAQDIEKNIYRLANKPVNCVFRGAKTDFKEHAFTEQDKKDQFAIGTMPETNNARIVYKDGVRFLRANAIIWKYLFPEAESILLRRKEVGVSIEIQPLSAYRKPNGVMVITDWDYMAITLLGYGVNPAINNTSARIEKYSLDSLSDRYLEKAMITYGTLVDSYEIPDRFKKNINSELGKVQTNPKAITEAIDTFNRNTLSYSEIIALKQKIVSFDESSRKLFSGIDFLDWTDAIEKERNGGTEELEKIKELLIEKFSDNLKYYTHNETTVFCFDYESAQFKGFEYSYKETEGVIDFSVVEEFKIVAKLEGSDEFKAVELITEDEKVQDLNMYSISEMVAMKETVTSYSEKLELAEKEAREKIVAYQEIETKLADIETNTKEAETKYSASLEVAKTEKEAMELKFSEAQEKALSYAALETELTELRTFKEEKEKNEKAVEVNNLYAKYSQYLTEEDTVLLNEKVSTMDIKDFTKEVYSIAVPKIEAKIEGLIKKQELDDKSNSNSLNYNLQDNVDVKDNTEKPKTALERIKELIA